MLHTWFYQIPSNGRNWTENDFMDKLYPNGIIKGIFREIYTNYHADISEKSILENIDT